MRVINTLSERSLENRFSVTDQKSGLKVSILHLLRATGKLLIGYFLMQKLDARSQQVVEFLQVLELYIFGDAYYDMNYQRNISLRKPVNLPKDDDIKILMKECTKIMSVDLFDYPHDSFVNITSAVATCLIVFNARRKVRIGKGSDHLVPVIFPPESVSAMKFLTKEEA